MQGFEFLVNSLTAAARLSFTWSEQQPEAISDRGRKDLRAVYGLHAREMLGCHSYSRRVPVTSCS